MTREGFSAPQIAQVLKVTVRTIQKDRAASEVAHPTPKIRLERREERRESVARMTRAGFSAPQIAQELKTTSRTVERDRKALKISQPPPVPLTLEEQRCAEQMLADGYPYTEVARTLGRHDTTIAKRYPGMSKVNGGQLARLNGLKRQLGLL